MEHFNNNLFHESGPANKQHTNQSIVFRWPSIIKCRRQLVTSSSQIITNNQILCYDNIGVKVKLWNLKGNQNRNYFSLQVSSPSLSIRCVLSCRPFVTFVLVVEVRSAALHVQLTVAVEITDLLGVDIFFCRTTRAVDRWSSNYWRKANRKKQ